MAILGPTATFREVREWYTRLAILERQVCLIEVEAGTQRGVGTGFLVAPDLVMTASHVVDRGWSSRFKARFDFLVEPGGNKTSMGDVVDFLPDATIASSPTPDLDISILRLQAAAGLKSSTGDDKPRGWVELNNALPQLLPGNPLAVLQHANAGPLKLALNTDSIVSPTDGRLARLPQETHWKKRFLHRTDTLPGSSGAPCFDIEWNFSGMHQGRAPIDGFACNFGISAAAVIDWIKSVGLWHLLNLKPPSHELFAFKSTSLEVSNRKLPEEIRAKLKSGEGPELELKETAIEKSGGNSRNLSFGIIKTVAAFMNSTHGGTILIGIDNSGQIKGVEQDYIMVNKQRSDWDSYCMWLCQRLDGALEADAAFTLYEVAKYNEDNREICSISVRPSPTPVFVNSEFYVRIGNMTTPKKGREMLSYYSRRWKNYAGIE